MSVDANGHSAQSASFNDIVNAFCEIVLKICYNYEEMHNRYIEKLLKNRTRHEYKYNGKTYHADFNEATQSWKIIDSYEILDERIMRQVCHALLIKNPVPTELGGTTYRTVDDMVHEWKEHSKVYYILYYVFSWLNTDIIYEGMNRAKDVDINPGDQGKDAISFIYRSLLGK